VDGPEDSQSVIMHHLLCLNLLSLCLVNCHVPFSYFTFELLSFWLTLAGLLLCDSSLLHAVWKSGPLSLGIHKLAFLEFGSSIVLCKTCVTYRCAIGRFFFCRGCYFQVGNEINMDMDLETAFAKSLRTLVEWVDANVSPKTQIFFRSFASVHFRYILPSTLILVFVALSSITVSFLDSCQGLLT
jgi:hypothetical protein